MNTKDPSNSVIFPPGGMMENENLSGKVRVKMLTAQGSDYPIADVTFEAACINGWHKYPGGQILLVTGGQGILSGTGQII